MSLFARASIPRISVVIPAFNAAGTIAEQLGALAAQSCAVPWEIVVADNGSTDDTVEIVRQFGRSVPRITLVDASGRRGPAAARNRGAASAVGDLLCFVDADDVVLPGWLVAVAEHIDDEEMAATGPMPRFSNDSPPTGRAPGAPRHLGLPYAGSANLIISRSLFEAVGGFDENWMTGEDVELSWRLLRRGVELKWIPRAAVGVRWAHERSSFRQYLRYGRSDPRLYHSYRDLGAEPMRWRAVAKSYVGIIARLPFLANPVQRLRWSHQAGRRVGRLVGSFESRTVYL